MSDRKLKQRLYTCLTVPESSREKVFVRRYEQRHLCLKDVFVREIKNLGCKSILAGVVLFLILLVIVKTGETHLIWLMSSALPACFLVCISWINSSEYYGMSELESSSRFSLRFLKMVRMTILGIISLIFISAFSFIIDRFVSVSISRILFCLGTPYLLNLWGCLLLLRKYHAREGVYGCYGIGALSCLLPLIMEKTELIANLSTVGMWVVLILVLTASLAESVMYMNKNADLYPNVK